MDFITKPLLKEKTHTAFPLLFLADTSPVQAVKVLCKSHYHRLGQHTTCLCNVLAVNQLARVNGAIRV